MKESLITAKLRALTFRLGQTNQLIALATTAKWALKLEAKRNDLQAEIAKEYNRLRALLHS